MKKDSNILIVGHGDVREQALCRFLKNEGYSRVDASFQDGLDVTQQADVREFFVQKKPEYIFLNSILSGGIQANQEKGAELIYQNLLGQSQVIEAAYRCNVKKLLYIASSCVYPKECPQPIREESLLTASLEPTSEAYAVAKIAGIKMCQAYHSQYGFKAIVMVPATVYGPGSSTDLASSHVLGALLGKFMAAIKNRDKEVVVWGSGKSRREFIFHDDFARSACFLMEQYDDPAIINAGVGEDVAVKDLAEMIGRITKYEGGIAYDESKPDGALKKLLDSSRINALGWHSQMILEEGILATYEYLKSSIL